MPEIAPLERCHDRNAFDCGIPELNAFLKTTARQHQQKGISKTFVLTDNSPTILGFFTLTLCELSTARLPAAYARKYPLHGLPAVKLARLAISLNEQKKGYGELLLANAIHRTVLIGEQAGLVGLFVDAKNETALRFYERYGFVATRNNSLLLFLPIETIRATI